MTLRCDDSSWCDSVSGLCQPRRGESEACAAAAECAEGLRCASGTCARRKAAGDTCNVAAVDECSVTESGMVCEYSADGGHCSLAEVVDEGEPCNAVGSFDYTATLWCEHGLTTHYCRLADGGGREGVCSRRPGPGEACSRISAPCDGLP
ncbi:MAG: Dickkopf N-terminal cysteine-rich domain-containing protein [Myxococcota bacterium]